MTAEYQNIELIYRFFDEVWNQGREEAIDELYAVGGEAHGLGDAYRPGPEAFKLLHRLLHRTCSDIHVELGDVIAAGDRLALRGRLTMTHKATGKEVYFEGGGFVQIKEGKIVEAWNGWDFLGLLVQLGAVPEDGLARALEGQAREAVEL